jgi:hypothetical protein
VALDVERDLLSGSDGTTDPDLHSLQLAHHDRFRADRLPALDLLLLSTRAAQLDVVENEFGMEAGPLAG